MKKLSLLTLALTMMTIAACSQDKAPVLRGADLPATMEGQYIYVYDGETLKDSVQVKGGTFSIDLPAETPVKLYSVELDTEIVPYFAEPGVSTIVPSEDGQKYAYDEGSTEFNTQVTELHSRLGQLFSDFVLKSSALQDEVETNGGQINEDIARRGQAVSDDFDTSVAALSREYFEKNKDNAMGILALTLYPQTDAAGFVEMYESAGEVVKGDEDLQRMYAALKADAATAAGAPFRDVTMKDETGEEAKVSDFMEEGKYLLIDVWASWCGPCRKAMPHIAEIAKGHASTITVLSIGGLNETPEDNAKARRELGMSWKTFFDSESIFAKTYSIRAIPTLLLISPDGSILVKTNNPADIDAKIAELGI